MRIEKCLFSFTALLYSTALKHQPPHFDTRAVQRLLFYLLFFLLHTSFSSTVSTVLIDPIFSSLLAGRGIPLLQLSSSIRLFHSTTSSYITIPPLSLFAAIFCRIAFPLVHHTNTHALRQLGRLGAGRPPPQTQRRKQNTSHASQERVHGSAEARQA